MANTMLPFLYQTRTIQRLSRPVPAHLARQLRSLLHTTAVQQSSYDGDPIPFDLPPELEKDPMFRKSSKKEKDYGTITPNERRAFDSIFKEIAMRSVASRKKEGDAQSKLKDPLDADYSLPDPQRERTIISGIIANAAKPIRTPYSPRRRNDRKNLHKFPPSLREAAEKAIGVLSPNDNIGKPAATPVRSEEKQDLLKEVKEEMDKEDELDRLLLQDDFTMELPEKPVPLDENADPLPKLHKLSHIKDRQARDLALSRMRLHEQARVENLMWAAKTDVELWDVLDHEVFSMVPRFEMATRKKKHSQEASDAEDGSHTTLNSQELDLIAHGPLYQSHLIYALRLMDSRFPGSPLALSILPRMKSMGLVSYVLGASVEFYTTLMKLFWIRYNDVHAVIDLMDEMKHAGLTFSRVHDRLLKVMEKQLLKMTSEGNEAESAVFSSHEWKILKADEIPRCMEMVYDDIVDQRLAEKQKEMNKLQAQ